MRPARGQRDGEGVRGSWVVHFGEGIDIGRGGSHFHFGEEIDIGILKQGGRLGSGSPGT